MKYIPTLRVFGVDLRQLPCLVGRGSPTTGTAGAVGELYMDEKTGALYKCVAVKGNVYTWASVASGGTEGGGSVIIDATLTLEGQAADAKAVGDRIGDISSALDELHTHAQGLINGGVTE